MQQARRGWLVVIGVALAAAAAKADDTAGGADQAAPALEAPQATPPVESPPPPVRRVVLRGIKFGSGTAYIEPASAGVLELVAQRMRENPQYRVRIEGYTDEQASEAYNLALSRERAEAVKRILEGFGIAPDRLDTVGYGESRPIASNDSAEGRALNRRVELQVLE